MFAYVVLLCTLLLGESVYLRNHSKNILHVDFAEISIGDKLELPKLSESHECETRYCIEATYDDQMNQFFDNTSNTDGWQNEVYQYARAVLDQSKLNKVADVGCGSGYKLVKYFDDVSTIGYDLEPTLSWLKDKYPKKTWKKSNFDSKEVDRADLVISADVVEHVPDPNAFLSYLLKFSAQYYVVSTPDRALMGAARQYGPPVNPSHVREWTHKEFAYYVSSHGFHILDARVYKPQMTMWFLLERSS